jgi:hypothetical protein
MIGKASVGELNLIESSRALINPASRSAIGEGTSKNTKSSALTEPLHDASLIPPIISRIKLESNTFYPVTPDAHNGYLSRLVLISAELPSRYQKM